jgi:hypothetical protein
MEDIPKHIILARAIKEIDKGEVSQDWKNRHFDIILYTEYGFEDPLLINSNIDDAQFREGIRRISLLSHYLGNEIRSLKTFDTEVFKLMATQILDCLDLTMDDEWLCESMQSASL